MKRYLVALAAAGVAGTVVLGSAAALNVDGGQVQAGSDTDLACQGEAPIRIVQRSEFDTPEPYSIGPQVSNIRTACDGFNIVVTAFDAGGTQLAKATMLEVDAGVANNGSWGKDVPLEDIDSLVVSLIN